MAEYRNLEKQFYLEKYPSSNLISRLWEPFRKPEPGDEWGKWELTKQNTLLHPEYEVDLDRMESSAAVLDWIIQVSNKSFVKKNPVELSNLVFAIDDILGLQQNYCGCGIELKRAADNGTQPE